MNGFVDKRPFERQPADGFQLMWLNMREGAAWWVEHRGSWRSGMVVHRGRLIVSVMLTGLKGQTMYVRRKYGNLRRLVIKTRLHAV